MEISIADRPFRFLVDTGGVYGEIDPQTVDALKLKTTPVENGVEIFHVRGAGGRRYVVMRESKSVIAALYSFLTGPVTC